MLKYGVAAHGVTGLSSVASGVPKARSRDSGVAVPARLPVCRAMLVCIVNLNEAIAGNIIWPFLPFLAARYALPEDVGFYTGMLAASYYFGQTLFVTLWGALADRWGRRPVILLGLLGSTLMMTWFGFARSYQEALAARFVCGVLNGNVAINKVYMGELTTADTQAQGFSWLTMTWGLGLIIAPTLGGYLAETSTQFPGSPLDTPFTRAFPYALPSLVAAGMGGFILFLSVFFLPETDAWRLRKFHGGAKTGGGARADTVVAVIVSAHRGTAVSDGSGGAVSTGAGTVPIEVSDSDSPRGLGESSAAADPEGEERELLGSNASDSLNPTPTEQDVIAANTARAMGAASDLTSAWGVMGAQQIGGAIACYGALATVQILFDELLPLFCSTPIRQGGLGWQASDVGVVQIGHGIVHMTSQLFLVPYVTRRYGLLTTLRFSILPLPTLLMLFPFVGLLASNPSYAMIVIVMSLALRALIFTHTFTSIMLLINNSTPAASLGFVTGVSQMVASAVRTIGPAVGGGIMSLGVSSESLGTWRLVPTYALMAVLSVFTFIITWGLVDCNVPPPQTAEGVDDGIKE